MGAIEKPKRRQASSRPYLGYVKLQALSATLSVDLSGGSEWEAEKTSGFFSSTFGLS